MYPPPDHRVAVCIGINAYPRRVGRLFGAVHDAVSMAMYLCSPAGGGFQNVHLLRDYEATWAGVVGLLSELADHEWQHLVVYFAGHGDAEGFELIDGFLSFRELVGLLDQIGARTTIVIADACESGGLVDRVDLGRAPVGDIWATASHIHLLARARPGMRVFTATSAFENAEEVAGRGVFTSVLLQKARLAPADLAAGGVSVERVFELTRRALARQGFPLPESTGRLRDLPFAISDQERPFGSASVRSAVLNVVPQRGNSATAEVQVSVTGRLYMPTTLALDVGDGAGRWLQLRRRDVTPGCDTSLYSLEGEFRLFSARLRQWPLRVTATDGHGHVVTRRVFEADVRYFAPLHFW